MSAAERRVPLDDVDLVKTIGTGTFSRVYLCRHRTRHTFSALKIMAMIRLKQVEHVKNEKVGIVISLHCVSYYVEPHGQSNQDLRNQFCLIKF
jgi:hypothetical protein